MRRGGKFDDGRSCFRKCFGMIHSRVDTLHCVVLSVFVLFIYFRYLYYFSIMLKGLNGNMIEEDFELFLWNYILLSKVLVHSQSTERIRNTVP